MNQTVVHSNEFILRVSEDGLQVRFAIINPHTTAGNDKQYDKRAWVAAQALLAFANLKRKNNTDDDSGDELHGQ